MMNDMGFVLKFAVVGALVGLFVLARIRESEIKASKDLLSTLQSLNGKV